MKQIGRNRMNQRKEWMFVQTLPDSVAKLAKMPTGIQEKRVILRSWPHYFKSTAVWTVSNTLWNGMYLAFARPLEIKWASLQPPSVNISFTFHSWPWAHPPHSLFIAFWMNIKRYITNGKGTRWGIGNEMLNAKRLMLNVEVEFC